MGLSILERPIGVGLGSSISAIIEQDYIGVATVKTTAPHKLIEDNYVYVKCRVEDYNGFWQIHIVDGFHFFLKNPDGSYVPYFVDASITYNPQTFTHGWSCVELPIVYKIQSDLFPQNNFDTPTTINAFNDTNGFLVLELNTSIPCDSLEYLQITGGTDGLAGIYQILEMIDNQTPLINLPFSDDFVSAGHTVTKYYSNYHAKVNIYSGLNSNHTFAVKKPYELAATLRLIPDSNNEIKFSINEILRSYINLTNNLLLGSLPNNIDAYTQFYIGIIESYDNSDGYTVMTQESAESIDQSNFEGFAVNAMLEFKNIQSGYLTDYIMGRNKIALFLTLFATPVLFFGCYHDMSMINDNTEVVNIKTSWALNKWIQIDNGTSAVAWTDNPAQVVLPQIKSSQFIIKPFHSSPGESFNFVYDIDQSGAFANTGNAIDLNIYFVQYDNTVGTLDLIAATSNAALISHSTTSPPHNDSGTAILTAVTEGNYIVMLANAGNIGVGSRTIKINSINGPSISFVDEKYLNGALVGSTSTPLADNGVYRMPIADDTYDHKVKVLYDGNLRSEIKELTYNGACANQEIKLGWLNNLGGFESWKFIAFKTYGVNISETGETKTNIFQDWPKSYGENANTINKQTFRTSTKQITVSTQYLTIDQLDALTYIKSSVLVEIVNDAYDKRRVIVDKDSFVSHVDNDKLHTLTFTITYTNDIPSQRT